MRIKLENHKDSVYIYVYLLDTQNPLFPKTKSVPKLNQQVPMTEPPVFRFCLGNFTWPSLWLSQLWLGQWSPPPLAHLMRHFLPFSPIPIPPSRKSLQCLVGKKENFFLKFQVIFKRNLYIFTYTKGWQFLGRDFKMSEPKWAKM